MKNTNRIHTTVVIGLCLFFSLQSCNKQSDTYTYTFINHTNKVIIIDIYRTWSDYNDAQYPTITGSIDPNARYSVPAGVLMSSHNYYVDWYSADFADNNWGDSTLVQFTPSSAVKTYDITTQRENNYRRLYLNGNLKETWWKAIDAFSNTSASSIWTKLSNQKKCQYILLNRALLGKHIYLNQKNDTVKDFFYFSLSNDSYMTVQSPKAFYMYSTTQPDSANVIDSAWMVMDNIKYQMIKSNQP